MWTTFYNVQHVGARIARPRTANGRPYNHTMNFCCYTERTGHRALRVCGVLMEGCRGEQCSPGGFVFLCCQLCGGIISRGRTLCAPTGCLMPHNISIRDEYRDPCRMVRVVVFCARCTIEQWGFFVQVCSGFYLKIQVY